MAARDGELRVFLVASEVSGDSTASCLMASLKILSPFAIHFAGVGGNHEHCAQNEEPLGDDLPLLSGKGHREGVRDHC
ncbi:hypothetical protein JHK85_001032 [Glycine max]|nr:hypothetical protein JHK85_001032 [Glycine max]KAG5088386.1 hypothetical protein JHK86_000998 [Glycine max]